ncbi:histidine kinase dimerization/phospho-acceptor domain-containing protein [Archangium sp.]|uniref:histidine kinase dimerization/phospho-acceptor domain-containing protein n=1 Tax=Archangium sp. TaxID=1872627 RepID=UPI002D47E48D|nr:histidine kinase dimerization/phospho-acceptor domain-containing protein [Archangium sp.]HYO51873.1 histidine kinase dimerization/phospho-acceptor domain-containing protein [Archangium sp.]
MGRSVSASEVERTLSAVAEQALHHGARAGLDALVEAAVRLTETHGAALYAGGRRVALAGLAPPAPARAHPLQLLKEGRTALVLDAPCVDATDRQHLTRLAVLGGALLACLEREDAARTERKRLRQERLRLMELLAHRERAWSRAAHDLRTPLLVLQGYIDMMAKGMAGVLTPSMQRYLERMGRAAGELNVRLQQRPTGEDAPAEDLRPLLSATFGPGRPGSARLELPAGPVCIRAPRTGLALLVRTLERLLSGAGASEVVLRVDAPDGVDAWRLLIQARAERPLPERALESLERLARRWEARFSVRDSPEVELTVLLPRLPG